MKKESFQWNSEGTKIPYVEAHTKARHQVTEDYIHDWVLTLCGNNIGQNKKITIVDGFCGGGIYLDEESGDLWEGSPLRLIRGIEKGIQSVRSEKSKPNYQLSADYYFIDSNKEHLDCLQKQIKLSEVERLLSYKYKFTFIHGDFEENIDKLINDFPNKGVSYLFILDPTGYSDVSMKSFRKIMGLGSSEVLYTYMIQFMKRFLKSRNNKLKNVHCKVLESEGYFSKINLDELDRQSQQSYMRNESIRLFRNRGKASYAYSFALIPEGHEVKYYLIHLANSPTAQKVIKQSLWKHSNIDIHRQFRFSVYGLGFRTPDYYENNMSFFDIESDNTQESIELLSEQLIPIINTHIDGINFKILHDLTMETNPSTYNHYESFINLQREYGEIEVYRKGKVTKAKRLNPGDIITRPQQATLFDLKRYISS